MKGGVMVFTVGLMVLGAGLAWGGHGRDLSDDELMIALGANDTMREYVERNGMPDVAEAVFLSDFGPWDRNEVVLYYLGLRKEVAFARASILGSPYIHLVRYERELSEADVRSLEKRRRAANDRTVAQISSGSATSRAVAAADRAEAAADRVEGAATRAEQAASRAEMLLAKLEPSHRHRRK